MPSAVRGAASPWFTGAGSDLLVTTCELKVPFKLQLTDHGQTTNTPHPCVQDRTKKKQPYNNTYAHVIIFVRGIIVRVPA
jgi:hypothetical protein